MLTSAGDDGIVRIWNSATGREVNRLTGHDGAVARVTYSPDGSTLATAGSDGTVRLWDPATGKGRLVAEGGGARAPQAVLFHPDGRRIAVGRLDGSVEFLDIASGRRLGRTLNTGHSRYFSFSLSPDGRTLASECDPNGKPVFCLWEVTTGRLRARLEGADKSVVVAMAPDGRSLAGGGEKGEVGLWDAGGGGRCLLGRHDGMVNGLAFSPDGRVVASASGDGTVRLWDVPPREVRGGERKLDPLKAEKLWADLCGPDAVLAYQAALSLSRFPEQSVTLLGAEALRKAAGVHPPNARHLALLVSELDADNFGVRERAEKELIGLGEPARIALSGALAGRPSAGLRKRVEQLLARLPNEYDLTPGDVCLVRCVEILERIRTPEAKRIIAKLSVEAPTDLIRREARGSLERLAPGAMLSRPGTPCRGSELAPPRKHADPR